MALRITNSDEASCAIAFEKVKLGELRTILNYIKTGIFDEHRLQPVYDMFVVPESLPGYRLPQMRQHKKKFYELFKRFSEETDCSLDTVRGYLWRCMNAKDVVSYTDDPNLGRFFQLFSDGIEIRDRELGKAVDFFDRHGFSQEYWDRFVQPYMS